MIGSGWKKGAASGGGSFQAGMGWGTDLFWALAHIHV